jgi:hypothetical protein
MSVYLSVSVCMEQLDSHWMDFDEIFHFAFFLISQDSSSFTKVGQE